MYEIGENWHNIPDQLKQFDQWCLAGADKAPMLVGTNGKLYNASPVTGPWLSFADACKHALERGCDIGFILTEQDPFTCIDFDVKDAQSMDSHGVHLPRSKWTPFFALERYVLIKNAFNSYTELSRSHKGMHIWLEGTVDHAVKRDGVEVYSKERFMVCTGIAVKDVYYSIFNEIAIATYPKIEALPLTRNDDLLDRLIDEIGGVNAVKESDPLIELEPTEPDDVIWKRALAADNGAKFKQLCAGEWQSMGYPSQSEADLSLMSMFCFYSKSYSQIRRMFRQTVLGQRDKAVKDDVYLDRTLILIRNRIRKTEEQLQKIEINTQMEARKLVQEMQAQRINEINNQAIESVVMPQVDGIDWPPGMVGALAGFIYNSAPRPVKEVAIVAALGLMAGIVGKTYTIPQSGLNLYIILVARSAVGKEAMHSGIGLIMDKLQSSIPGSARFIDFGEFASGPALTKACAENQSFLNVSGEWGRRLRRMASDDGREGPMQQLRTVMTNLYQKSGPASVVGGINYSNKDTNVKSVSGVAYSMIGESTPKTFYEALTESMMEDGFMSRFLIVEFQGDRPPRNANPCLQLDERLYSALCSIVVQSITLLQNRQTMQVQFSVDAQIMLDEFDKECDEQINSTDDEGYRQMWNRAHLKVLRIAALLATADNFITPVVSYDHAKWALDVVRRDIAVMQRKITEGDVGQGDVVREKKLISVIKGYFTSRVPESYRIPEALVKNGIIPRKFMQMRTNTLTQFTGHRLGSTIALDLTIKSLIDSGYLMEVDKNKMAETYNFHGRCFRVLNL